MKRLFYVAALAALTFASCEKDTFQSAQPTQPEESGYGTLLLGDASISVSTETDIKTSRATEGSTYDNYCIWVTRTDVTPEVEVDLDKANTSATHTTYGSVKENGISLPAGTYTLKVQSSALIPNAAFEAPVYTAEEPGIVITAGETNDDLVQNPIVCKLNDQVKVSVDYNDLFKEHIAGSGMATVTINTNQSLEYPITYESSTNKVSWKKDAGYFKVSPASAEATMEVSVDVMMKVKTENGTYETKKQKMTSAQIKVKACQWRQIEFQMQVEKNGTASFSVKIGDLDADVPLTVDTTTSEDQVLGEDPLAPKSDGDIRLLNTAGLNIDTTPKLNAWNSSFTFGNPSFAPTKELGEGEVHTDMDIDIENAARKDMVIVIDDKLTKNATTNKPQLQFKAYVPGKIAEFKIKIISDVIDEVALQAAGVKSGNELDIINRPDEVVGIATLVPFPYEGKKIMIETENDEPTETTLKIKGETELDFVLDDAIPLLQDLIKGEATSHEHTFQMIVKDEQNRKKTVDLKLQVIKPQDNTSSN